MTIHHLLIATAVGTTCCFASAAERLTVSVTNTLELARPAETIVIPWSSVNQHLPGALLQQIVVKDAAGNVLPYQVTNVKPQAKDPRGEGVAYGELLFQHDFEAGEKSATFTVEKTTTVSPPFPSKVFARYIPERLDDFAWENDKIAHRTYGPALAAPAEPGSGKEVLVTSGMDIWFKRVSYPIVDRWYNKGHDHYHHDEGEGIDMYNVGQTRGNGGTGVWDGKELYTGVNYSGWKVVTNGPVRAIFELTYAAWDAAGVKVSEVKRFTVDAGHYFDQIDSTFSFAGPQQLTVAIGINKTPSDKKQDPTVTFNRTASDKALVQWVEQRSNGAFGTAIILPSAGEQAYAEDARNALILAPVTAGKPLRYYVGAAWTRAGDFKSGQDWQRYVAAESARVRAPVTVSVSGTR
jgi:pectinesterase